MKKFKVLAVIMVLMFVAGTVFAATPSTLKRQAWHAEQKFKKGIKVGDNDEYVVDADGNLTSAGGETPERSEDISIWDLALKDSGIESLGTTKPGYVYDPQSPSLVWLDDTYASPALKTLKLPEDYLSGLGYRLLITETGDSSNGGYKAPNSSPGYVEYTIYIHSDGNLADSVGYAQTAVRLSGITGVLHELDLPIILSDTTVLTASNTWVTLEFGRGSDSINAQWVHGVQMYYTPEY